MGDVERERMCFSSMVSCLSGPRGREFLPPPSVPGISMKPPSSRPNRRWAYAPGLGVTHVSSVGGELLGGALPKKKKRGGSMMGFFSAFEAPRG